MVTLSSILFWEISWTEEPDGLQFVHDVNEHTHKAQPRALQSSPRLTSCLRGHSKPHEASIVHLLTLNSIFILSVLQSLSRV